MEENGSRHHRYADAMEPLLLKYEADLAILGHVHNFERFFTVYSGRCKTLSVKDANGIDTYNTNYTVPVQAIMGMVGFKLDGFVFGPISWSLVRISDFGYTKIQATKTQLNFQFINMNTQQAKARETARLSGWSFWQVMVNPSPVEAIHVCSTSKAIQSGCF
ncbi:putative inactive purple acid phosphatase 24 [Drosera capensis]